MTDPNITIIREVARNLPMDSLSVVCSGKLLTAAEALAQELADTRLGAERQAQRAAIAEADLRRAQQEIERIGDRGDHMVYRHEWEAFDRWQRQQSATSQEHIPTGMSDVMCQHPNHHFNRTVCACGLMHTYCDDCGAALGRCRQNV